MSGMMQGIKTLFNISPKYPSVFNIGFSELLITGILFMVFTLVIPKKILK